MSFCMTEGSGLKRTVLARIFRVQLGRPLLGALRPLATNLQSLGLAAPSLDGRPLETFGDLFQHPSPPLPLLRLAKDFAKCADTTTTAGQVPADIATALYFLTIATAILRHRSCITTLNIMELEEGLEWTSRQPWLDAPIRQVAATALNSIEF
jgi:hypothetical protein